MASQEHTLSSESERIEPVAKPSRPSKFETFLQKAGLTMPVPLLMIKAAVAPTVALAMYQSDAIPREYSTQGYLIAITSVLGLPVLPRAKFIQNMFLNLLAACIATAMALLSTWSAVQARQHTTPRGQPPTGYNSSASAVCAVWLFFQIFLVNSIRSKLPQMMFAVIIYAIFANIALTYGVNFATNTVAINFAKNLLKAFLTGFALATGSHFVVFPSVSARRPVWGEMTGMLGAMRGILKTQTDYMHTFENEHALDTEMTPSESSGEKTDLESHKLAGVTTASKPPATKPMVDTLAGREQAVKAAGQALHTIIGKLHADIPAAKKEVAWGKFGPEDVSDLMEKLRGCALPLFGLGSLYDLLNQAAQLGGWDMMLAADKSKFDSLPDVEKQEREHSFKEWQAVMRTMHEPFGQITDAMDCALEHVLLTLEFQAPPKASKKKVAGGHADLEGQKDNAAPGEPGFAAAFEQKIARFYDSRQMTLQHWCEQQGLSMPTATFDTEATEQTHLNISSLSGRRHRVQIYVILYMEYLIYAASKALLDMVRYADGKVSDGTLKKSRLITPGNRRLGKWLKNTLSKPDASFGGQQDLSGSQQEALNLDFGEGYTKHDPEHLPPTNAFERLGNLIRLIPRTLRSEHCAHGFRAACATLSVAIVCYLRDTQRFFVQQRLVWAMIMIAFSMQRTAGQSVFQFALRTAGTAIAMVASYVIWYIVNGHTAGVIVFEFLYICGSFWVLFNKPRYTILGVLGAITSILIIDELQVKKIGTKASETNGQPAYALYELAPYRLATVVGGLFVAYIWTILPYPISEHTELRRDVSSTMHLLARYYSIVHETVKVRGDGTEGDLSVKSSPGHILEKARHTTFVKTQVLLNELRDVASYSRWQFDFGGRFPLEIYQKISDRLERIMRCMSLIGYASTSFRVTHHDEEKSDAEWLTNFKTLIKEVDPTSQEITTRLSMLAACLRSATPLPPYMPCFEPFHLLRRLHALDKDILSVRHLAEPGYAAFAVLQIASRQLVDELNLLTENVRDLCGEMDFRVKIADEKP